MKHQFLKEKKLHFNLFDIFEIHLFETEFIVFATIVKYG